MTQIVPATAVLGPSKTGLVIGYRVLDIDRVEYSAFSTTGVVETDVPGTYSKTSGVVAPNAGGYIVWGTSGTDLAEDDISPPLFWSGDAPVAGVMSATAVLGANKTGLDIGYRVLDIDRVEYVGFSTSGVVETLVPGTYSKTGGILVPDTGGYIVWGTLGVDLAEDEISPSRNTPGTGMYYEDLIEEISGADYDTLKSLSDQIDNVQNGITGIGSIPFTYTVTEPGGVVPISGVTVELYTEEALLNCVRRGVTNSYGVVTFWMSTVGTYWIKSAKDGYSFELDSEVVTT